MDMLLTRSLRGKKATGTRMLALKCLIELGQGWHTCGEVMRKMTNYIKDNKPKVDYIFELAAKYPKLIEIKKPLTKSLKDVQVRVRDKAYPVIIELIEEYMNRLKGGK